MRLGLLSASGANLKTALSNLEDELLALASSEAATLALAAERARMTTARDVAHAAAKPATIAKYSSGATVEALLSVRGSDDTWCEVEYLNERHGGQLHAVWSERLGTLVLPDVRVRYALPGADTIVVNSKPAADVG